MLELLIPTVFAALVAHLLAERLPETVRRSGPGLVRDNFLGDAVPTSQGIIFVLAASLAIFASMPLKLIPAGEGGAFLFGLMGMSLVGILDDAVGSRESQGFRGHLGELVTGGRLTTGALKALYGGGVALAAAAAPAPDGLLELLLSASVIALGTNAVNLLDLRPGRAAKFYLAVSAALLTFAPVLGPFLLPLSAAVLVYLPKDLAASAMMGDAGANALGFALGFAVALVAGPTWLLLALGALVTLHAAAERISLGAWIERLPFLRTIDAWGRSETARDERGTGERGEDAGDGERR